MDPRLLPLKLPKFVTTKNDSVASAVPTRIGMVRSIRGINPDRIPLLVDCVFQVTESQEVGRDIISTIRQAADHICMLTYPPGYLEKALEEALHLALRKKDRHVLHRAIIALTLFRGASASLRSGEVVGIKPWIPKQLIVGDRQRGRKKKIAEQPEHLLRIEGGCECAAILLEWLFRFAYLNPKQITEYDGPFLHWGDAIRTDLYESNSSKYGQHFNYCVAADRTVEHPVGPDWAFYRACAPEFALNPKTGLYERQMTYHAWIYPASRIFLRLSQAGWFSPFKNKPYDPTGLPLIPVRQEPRQVSARDLGCLHTAFELDGIEPGDLIRGLYFPPGACSTLKENPDPSDEVEVPEPQECESY